YEEKGGKEDQAVRQTQNSKYYESLETPPIKRTVGRPKKSVSANENKSSSVKRRGRPAKGNDEEKNQTVGSKGKKNKDSSKSKNKNKANENNMNCKIRTRTTPKALFNAMAILSDDRKKCLHEMGFASMIGMGIYELLGKLGYYVIDNFDTESNVLSLNDSSILVTSESVNDILGIPMGGSSIESLEPRTADDPFIKEWLSQFGEKTKIRPNDISEIIVATKDAGKLFKMNFLMLFANTMGLCETSGVCSMNILKQIRDDVCVKTVDWCNYIMKCLKDSKNNFDTESNVLSLNDSSILVTSESVNDILGIPMGGSSEFDVIRQTPAIRNWKSVQMKHREKLEKED
nr:hypothetical protein [Tanacetum cinerariifolium]